MTNINPACINKKTATFLKPDGTYLPCCWASTNPDVRDFLGDDLYSQLNLYLYSVDEIMQSQAYKLIIEKMLSDNPFRFCKDVCSEIRTDQFVSTEKYVKDGVNQAAVIKVVSYVADGINKIKNA